MFMGQAIPVPGVGQVFSIGGSGTLLVVGVAACPMAIVGGGQLAPVVGLQGSGTLGGFIDAQLTNPAALAKHSLS